MNKRTSLRGAIAAAVICAGLSLGAVPTVAMADAISDLYGTTYDRDMVVQQGNGLTAEEYAAEQAEEQAAADQAYAEAAASGESALAESGTPNASSPNLARRATPTVKPRAMSGEMLYFCKWESGQNYAQTLSAGDGYHAMGFFQFDNRYDLGSFLQAVYNYNPTKYSALKVIGTRYGWNVSGATRSNGAFTQLGNDLNTAWTACYKKDPTEFANLQNGWAYDAYYLPAEQYMASRGVPISNRSDSVKSLCWGMSNLFGTNGWHLFVGGYAAGYDWNGNWNSWRDWPGAGLRANMTDQEFVTALCDYVVNNVSVFYKAQSQYWNGWQNRYRGEKAHYLDVLGTASWSVTGVRCSSTNVTVGTTVTYSATVAGTVKSPTYNYVWQYGDDWSDWGSTGKDNGGAFVTATSGTFTPTKDGTYTLYVDVKDAYGNKRTASTKVTVTDPNWKATALNAPDVVHVGERVSYSASVSGTIKGATYNYVWQYGSDWSEWGSTAKDNGGQFTTATTGSFTPAKAGDYTLYVDVVDSAGKKQTVSRKLRVIPEWNATGVTAPAIAKRGSKVTFSANISGGPVDGATYNYVWQYGDDWSDWGSTGKSNGGKFTTATSGSFTPTKNGTYTLYVDVVDSAGRKRTASTKVVVNDCGWAVASVKAPATGTVGKTLSFSAVTLGTVPGATYNYVWQYGSDWSDWSSTAKAQGSFTTSATGTFIPSKPGTYTLYVDVVDSAGNKQTASTKVTVNAPSWNATGIKGPATAYVGDRVTYSPVVSGTVWGATYNYVWQYGDDWSYWGSTAKYTGGKFTTATSGSFTPGKAGDYNLYVDVVDGTGKKQTVSAKLRVLPAWTATGVSAPATAKRGSKVTFSAMISGGPVDGATYNYVWQYGSDWSDWGSTGKDNGGQFTTATTGSFTPTKAGTYTLYVDVVDSAGKKQTVSTKVTVS